MFFTEMPFFILRKTGTNTLLLYMLRQYLLLVFIIGVEYRGAVAPLGLAFAPLGKSRNTQFSN